MNSAARYCEAEAEAGRLADEMIAAFPVGAEMDWRIFARRVRAFQRWVGLRPDGKAGPLTRRAILGWLIMPRINPVEPWHGRDAIVSSPFADARRDGPHRGTDYMHRLRRGDEPECPVYRQKWIYPTRARAAAAGIVTSIVRISNGTWCWISHAHEMRTQYGHLGEIQVEEKQAVSLGQILGGPCGRHRMWPPHLHAGLKTPTPTLRGFNDFDAWLTAAS